MLHESELINIEEEMIINPTHMLRRFTLNNRINGLSIGIDAIGARISSIKVDGGKDELITTKAAPADSVNLNNGQRYEWNSHVLGLDSLLLTSNSSSHSILYQLTKDNELLVNGKFKGQQQLNLYHPCYFNLNSSSSTIDGHLLQVQASNDFPEIGPAISVSGDDLPFDLSNQQLNKITRSNEFTKPQYDVIVSCLSDILATIEYESKRVEIVIHNKGSSNNNNSAFVSCCRLRLRLNKDGVSLMPTHMNEFQCIYKFTW